MAAASSKARGGRRSHKLDKLDLVKFPRTRHLLDVGGTAVTRDDLLMTEREANRFLKGKVVSIEEKIDGANLGFSMDEDFRIRAQNRSHFVDSATHRQFSALDSWMSQNSKDLLKILDHGKFNLYGEWVYAKHSIFYTRLPSYFIAFDLYDTKNQQFVSRRERDSMLSGTNMWTVPLIAEKQFKNIDELLPYMETKSAYYDGPVEGIYLRVDSDAQETQICKIQGQNISIERSKIVRPDFLQQIEEQWTRQTFTKNICTLYYP